jgi:hypothetical protein
VEALENGMFAYSNLAHPTRVVWPVPGGDRGERDNSAKADDGDERDDDKEHGAGWHDVLNFAEG